MSGPDNGAARILVVDSEETSRALMCALLSGAGHEPAGLAGGEQALEEARRDAALLVILEVELPDVCGYHVCRALRDEFAEGVSIVFISATRTESFDRVAGMLLGADDYLSKPIAPDEFLARIGRLVDRSASTSVASSLTGRETEVLRLLADGLTQKEIAHRLLISGKTVGTHIEHIFSKLGVSNRLQAVAVAHRQNLVSRSRPDGGAPSPFTVRT
jgi:DNA-binding NarL/FixJ family response regulator